MAAAVTGWLASHRTRHAFASKLLLLLLMAVVRRNNRHLQLPCNPCPVPSFKAECEPLHRLSPALCPPHSLPLNPHSPGVSMMVRLGQNLYSIFTTISLDQNCPSRSSRAFSFSMYSWAGWAGSRWCES